MSNTKIFDDIYRNAMWGSNPRSGSGSSLAQTSALAAALPTVFEILGVRRLIDCGCGDLNWMPHVDLSGIEYEGFDVSPSVIADNKKRFPDKNLSVKDICLDALPSADLALSRDVLVHLPFSMIFDFLRNLKKSGVEYLATTSFPSRNSNVDCSAGDWRTLNFEENPFHFPMPVVTINERLEANGQLYRDKSTCVWRVDSIPLTSCQ